MLYRLEIIGNYDKVLIKKIQDEHYGKVDGIYDLYSELYVRGYCNSYEKHRIYYVAYTLAKHKIDFKIRKVD